MARASLQPQQGKRNFQGNGGMQVSGRLRRGVEPVLGCKYGMVRWCYGSTVGYGRQDRLGFYDAGLGGHCLQLVVCIWDLG